MPASVSLSRLGALALLLPLGAHAQTALVPGSPELASPPPQSYDFVVTMEGTPPQVIGTLAQGERLDGDRLVMTLRVDVARGGEQHADTLVVAWPSLAPLSRSSHAADETLTLRYAGGRVAGRSVLGNLDETLDAPLPPGVFGPGSGARLARSLPFAEGYTATFQTVDTHGGVATGHLRVAEYLPQPDGDMWTVEVKEPGGYPTLYFIDAATREIVGANVRPNPSTVVVVGPAE